MISRWLSPTQTGPFPEFSWRAVLYQAVTCRSSALEVALGKTQANVSPESAFPPHFPCPQSFVRGGYSTWDMFVPTSMCSIEPTTHWRAASWVKWALILSINYFSAAFILNHYFLLKQKLHGTMPIFFKNIFHSRICVQPYWTQNVVEAWPSNVIGKYLVWCWSASIFVGYVPRGWSVPV